MRNLYVLFFVLFIALMSCDGRDRKYKTNADVLKANKLFDSFSEQVKYMPEQPTEVFTDTILSTGFQVKIKYYALENDVISKTSTTPNDHNKTVYFKNFEAQFQVSKNNNLLIRDFINKKMFTKFESHAFWAAAVMQFVWVDYENSTEEFLTLNTSFHIPETKVYKDFSIVVNKFGKIKIRQIDLVENVL